MADTSTRISSGIGHSVDRPDGVAKVDGSFEFSNDLHHERMLWGATVRSPIPHGRIRSVDIGPALAMPGVAAVVTHEDVPRRELAVFAALARSSTAAVSKAQLLDAVYGAGANADEQVIEVYVSRLRKRLRGYGVKIAVKRGIGYSLETGS